MDAEACGGLPAAVFPPMQRGTPAFAPSFPRTGNGHASRGGAILWLPRRRPALNTSAAHPASRRPLIAVWLAMTIFTASAAVLTRCCRLSAIHIGFWRVFGAAVVLAPFAAVIRRRMGRPPLFTRGAAITGVFLGVHFATWAWALQHTTLANAALFVGLQPLMAPWVARPLIGERLTAWEKAACALASVGTIWILGRQFTVEREHLAGTLVALLSAFLCACYFVLSRKCRADQHAILFTVPVYLTAAAVQALGALALTGRIAAGDAPTRWALAGLILFPTVGGHTLAIYLLRHVKSQLVTLSVPTQFILVTVAGAVLFDETPGPHFLAGAALVIAGVALGVWKSEPAGPAALSRGS
jgi:drug/metabolite transporter (DMT)-like permease